MDKKKLTAYCNTALAFLLVNEKADAQVVYENIDPDIIEIDANYDTSIDINHDGVTDITFNNFSVVSWSYNYYEGWYINWIRSYFFINDFDAVAGGGGAADPYNIKLFSPGDVVGSSAFWNTNEDAYLGRVNSGATAYSPIPEDWFGEDKYMGIRFKIGEETHYGWIRLSIRNFSDDETEFPSLTIQEMAYEAMPDVPITIASGAVDMAKNVLIKDVDESATISDLEVSFDAAENEENIAEYRVFLYQGLYPPEKSVSELTALGSAFYNVVEPGADNYSVILSDLLDIAGNPIEDSTFYVPLVLSVSNDDAVLSNNLSLPGNTIEQSIHTANYAYYIYGHQDYCTYSANDFYVTFKFTTDPKYTDTFKVFILDNYEVELNELLALPDNYYTALDNTPETTTSEYNFYTAHFNIDKLIYPGGTPELFERYYFAVVSLPDTQIATDTILNRSVEDFSGYVDYFCDHFDVTPDVELVTNTYTLADVLVQMPHFKNEHIIYQYDIYVVPNGQTFTPDNAYETTYSDAAYPVSPDSTDISEILPLTQVDVNYQPINIDRLYQIYIGVITAENNSRVSLSNPSAPFKLSQPRAFDTYVASAQGNTVTIHMSRELELPFSIRSMDGQSVYEGVTTGIFTECTLTHLATGMYFVYFPGSNLKSTILFIKP